MVDPGKEKVIALCSTTQEYIPGIKYDFKTADFAEQGTETNLNRALGDAATSLTRAIRVEGAGSKKTKKKAKDKKVAVVGKKPIAQSRKAISLVVKK
ncbi:MAG: hypothetical protein L3J32_04615 [Rhizobiaceae bacterium]|nr:hypothetical protein [Rhizobiaceae bacterium]